MKLIAEPETAAELAAIIQASAIGKLMERSAKHIGVLYFPPGAGQLSLTHYIQRVIIIHKASGVFCCIALKHIACSLILVLPKGEPVTHPHLRICPLRDDHLKKLIKGVPRSALAERRPQASIRPSTRICDI